ncbi:MAG TPA: AtpZ/AtpI family protein [Bryobacteraceae bacterium]|nr:AtpZ/AtpI family protein [Bryobacteraceae bacterium]
MARRKRTAMEQWGLYSGLAFLLPAATFVGYLIGYLLDKAFGTHFLYLPFLLLGIGAGIYQLIREVTKDSADGDS